MKERPILFNGAMVRAILSGAKTQTRRAVKPQPSNDPARHHPIAPYHNGSGAWNWVLAATGHGCGDPFACPFGQPGDRLWVREPWRTTGDDGRADKIPPRDLQRHAVWFDADGNAPADHCVGKPRRSFHMPRWACRLVLEISAVRVERLQEIDEAGARAEGITDGGCCTCGCSEPCGCHNPRPDARDAFIHLWESTGGDWLADPWVWVIEFKQVTA
ncbi:hypothetical protein [Xanthomonas translucens]|uniref:hypothetical protein n=1 Tax=Xanthomonas campestris pv. translucens TaxID=343 RepID=UPI0009C19494|nr:hypothetical protein [Xanthomonas translucens]